MDMWVKGNCHEMVVIGERSGGHQSHYVSLVIRWEQIEPADIIKSELRLMSYKVYLMASYNLTLIVVKCKSLSYKQSAVVDSSSALTTAE